MKGSPITKTASAVVLDSGKPIKVYGLSLTSGNTGGLVHLRNGSAVTDSAIADVAGIPNQAFQMESIPAEGLYFPSGLYVDMDGNTSSVTVWAELVTRA